MPLYYVGRYVACPGNPSRIADELRETVVRFGLADVVREARFSPIERRSPARRPRRGAAQPSRLNYRRLFLRVEADCGHSATESMNRLLMLHQDSSDTHIEFDEGGINLGCVETSPLFEPAVYLLGRRVAAPHAPSISAQVWAHAGDPLAAPAAPTPPESIVHPSRATFPTASGNAHQTECHDRLLMWLSAAGRGSWETFARVAQQVGAARSPDDARRLMRRLILLGHVERSPDGSRWAIAPPVLVQIPAEPELAHWAGQRTTLLRESLPHTWDVTEQAQPRSEAPSRWLVELPSPDSMLPGAAAVSTTICDLAERLPKLEEWAACLPHLSVLARVEGARRWHDGGWHNEPEFRVDPYTCRPSGPVGLYELQTPNHGIHATLTGYLDADDRFRRGDWYGLRFLALEERHAYLDTCGSALFVPASQRWPLLFERALVLASGQLPQLDTTGQWLRYSDVLCHPDWPSYHVEYLCELLGVNLHQMSTNLEPAHA